MGKGESALVFQFRQKIGMRTVKTAVAVALCLAVGVVFSGESIFTPASPP